MVVAVGLIPASASALQGVAPTTVTIKEKSGDFSGKVSSTDPSCRGERTVKVKLVQPGKDQTVASDTSDSNGSWSTGNTDADPGDYYAKVRKTLDCAKARSEVITVN